MNNIGPKSGTWKGGKTISSQGYILLSAAQFGGPRQILEHRWIMQQHLGRKLKSSEIVHHINENKTDNRIENLHITDRSKHAREHGIGRITSENTRKKISESHKRHNCLDHLPHTKNKNTSSDCPKPN